MDYPSFLVEEGWGGGVIIELSTLNNSKAINIV
jgi:hypothetical protein